MAQPIDVDLPHKLGREEARRRIATNIGTLQRPYSRAAPHVTSNWVGDRLDLDISAMGQTVDAPIDVEETKVRCHVVLPGMLGMFAAPIEAMLKRKGGDCCSRTTARS